MVMEGLSYHASSRIGGYSREADSLCSNTMTFKMYHWLYMIFRENAAPVS